MEKLYLIAIIGLALFIPTYVFAVDPSATITMIPGQTTNPWVIKDSGGVTKFSVSPNGTITGILAPISGNITISKSGFPNTEIDAGSGTSTASYIIGISGSTFYAKNGTTGQIKYSSTSGTTVVNNAEADLPSSGGHLIFTAGTFPVSISVTKTDVTFQGQSDRSTKLTRDGNNPIFSIVGNNHAITRTTIMDLRITGTPYVVGATDCIFANQTSYLKIERVGMLGCNGNGIYLQETWDSRIDNLEMEYSGNTNTGKSGIYLFSGSIDNTNNIYISNSRFETMNGTDIKSEGTGGGVNKNNFITIISTKFESHNPHDLVHVNFTKTSSSEVIGSIFSSAVNDSMYIGPNTDNTRVIGNWFFTTMPAGEQPNATHRHIDIQGTNSLIIDNTFQYADQSQINVGTSATGTQVAGNTYDTSLGGGNATEGKLINVINTQQGSLLLGTVPSDPTSLTNGQIWYSSSAGFFKGRAGGATVFLLGNSEIRTVQNKNFDSSNSLSDVSDHNKKFNWDVSGFTTSHTNTWTIPNKNSTFAGIDFTQTFSNKQSFTPTSVTASLNLGTTSSYQTSPRQGDISIAGNTLMYNDNSNTTQTVADLGLIQTFLKPITFTTNATRAGLNLGTTASTPTNTLIGDLYIAGTNMAFKDTTGATQTIITNNVAHTISAGETFSGTNTFSNNQTVSTGQNIYMGTANITTSAVRGYLYLSTTDGVPTGTPASHTGGVPVTYDGKENKLCVYNGAWKCVILS